MEVGWLTHPGASTIGSQRSLLLTQLNLTAFVSFNIEATEQLQTSNIVQNVKNKTHLATVHLRNMA